MNLTTVEPFNFSFLLEHHDDFIDTECIEWDLGNDCVLHKSLSVPIMFTLDLPPNASQIHMQSAFEQVHRICSSYNNKLFITKAPTTSNADYIFRTLYMFMMCGNFSHFATDGNTIRVYGKYTNAQLKEISNAFK